MKLTHYIGWGLERFSRAAGNQGGYTLIEALVGIAVMAIIVSVMASGVTQAFRAAYFQRTGATAVDEGRRLIPVVTRDLQVATQTNLIDGNPPISLAPGTDLTITQQEPDPAVGVGSYTIVYSLVGSELVRSLDGTPRTVARHVASAQFSVSGAVYTVSLTTQSEGNTRSEATNTWVVYQRTIP
jgi:prepilin-type N-terminal cleavage/methylation domain-containing protein